MAIALLIVAIVGSDEVNAQEPGESEVGAINVTVLGDVEDNVAVTFGNVPCEGSAARTVTVIEIDADA